MGRDTVLHGLGTPHGPRAPLLGHDLLRLRSVDEVAACPTLAPECVSRHTLRRVEFAGTESVGWYISIAAFPVYMAGVLGLFFGCFVLPRFAPAGGTKWPSWARTIG